MLSGPEKGVIMKGVFLGQILLCFPHSGDASKSRTSRTEKGKPAANFGSTLARAMRFLVHKKTVTAFLSSSESSTVLDEIVTKDSLMHFILYCSCGLFVAKCSVSL